MPILILFVFIVVVFFVLPALFSESQSSRRQRHTATVRKTMHDSYTGKNGEIENRYTVMVLFHDTSKRAEYEIEREEYGLLCEGDEVVVTPKENGYAECTLKRKR